MWYLYSPGSYAFDTPEMLDITERRLAFYGGGERRFEQRSWLQDEANRVARRVGLPPVVSDSYLPYSKLLALALLTLPRVASKLRRHGVESLRYAEWATTDHEKYGGLASAPFMVGMPTPSALKTFAGVFGHTALFEDLMVEQVRRIRSALPDDTVIQWELPLETSYVGYTPPRLRRRVARMALRPLERVIRRSPPATRFAFHLCWGDLGNRPVPMVRRGSRTRAEVIRAIVEMAVWDRCHLAAVHDPFCDGVNPPVDEPAGYADHAGIRLPPGALYAAGVLHPRADEVVVEGLAGALAERVHAGAYAIGPSCGDGRQRPDVARALWTRGVAIARRLPEVSADGQLP